jgi:hypothetical protein
MVTQLKVIKARQLIGFYSLKLLSVKRKMQAITVGNEKKLSMGAPRSKDVAFHMEIFI